MSVVTNFHDESRACMPICLDLGTYYYNASKPQQAKFLSLPGETRNMIYTFVYGDVGVFTETSKELARPLTFIQLDDNDVNTGARKDELVKFGFAHRITGLQDTCRQIRLETEHFNPLWKSICGSPEALYHVFDQPNPFEYVRIVTIYLEVGDIIHEQGQISLSEKLECLLVYLACLRYLGEVRLHGSIHVSDSEEKYAFDSIWKLLKMGTWIRPDFMLLCYSHRLQR